MFIDNEHWSVIHTSQNKTLQREKNETTKFTLSNHSCLHYHNFMGDEVNSKQNTMTAKLLCCIWHTTHVCGF